MEHTITKYDFLFFWFAHTITILYRQPKIVGV